MPPGRRVAVLACLLLAVQACAPIRLTPPAAVADPVTVTVVDYGDSSRLLLPRPDGSFVEYGYGEWKWYALNRESKLRGPIVLFWPTAGALGRREHDTDPTPPTLPSHPTGTLGEDELIAIEVERPAATALVARLDARFEARRDELVTNHVRGLDFVPDDDDYWLGCQSTTTVRDWLREMGVRADGFALRARYVLVPTAPR